MPFQLTDDGTMDTVVRCSECGQEERYNYDGGEVDEDTGPPSYDAYVQECCEDADTLHDCPRREMSE